MPIGGGGDFDKLIQGVLELLGVGVIGVGIERFDPPAAVGGVGKTGATSATEVGEMAVADAGVAQRGLERLAAEVRLAARAREAADIGDKLDAMGLQDRQQVGELAVRVADGPDLVWGHEIDSHKGLGRWCVGLVDLG